MHCAVADAAGIVERNGSASMHEVMDRVLDAAEEEISRYEGVISQRHADGLVAVFGAEVSHEDDGRRAILAGLTLQRRVSGLGLATGSDEPRLDLRIGIHVGPLVITRVAGARDTEYSAVGETMRTADLLHQFAVPGTILISEPIWRTVDRHIAAEEMVPAPPGQRAFRVIGPLRTQAGVRPPRPTVVPFRGRQQESALLDRLGQQALAGKGQVVSIVGEPGMGKSRLVLRIHARDRAALGRRHARGTLRVVWEPHSVFAGHRSAARALRRRCHRCSGGHSQGRRHRRTRQRAGARGKRVASAPHGCRRRPHGHRNREPRGDQGADLRGVEAAVPQGRRRPPARHRRRGSALDRPDVGGIPGDAGRAPGRRAGHPPCHPQAGLPRAVARSLVRDADHAAAADDLRQRATRPVDCSRRAARQRRLARDSQPRRRQSVFPRRARAIGCRARPERRADSRDRSGRDHGPPGPVARPGQAAPADRLGPRA